MAIPGTVGDREHQKFKEATAAAGQVGVVVLNPDGSTIGFASGSAVKDGGPAIAGTATYTASADMTAPAVLSPAPTAGQKLLLLQAIVSVDTAMELSLQEETSGTVFASVFLPANGTVVLVPRYPIKLATADKRWQGKASAAGKVRVTLTTTSEA